MELPVEITKRLNSFLCKSDQDQSVVAAIGTLAGVLAAHPDIDDKEAADIVEALCALTMKAMDSSYVAPVAAKPAPAPRQIVVQPRKASGK